MCSKIDCTTCIFFWACGNVSEEKETCDDYFQKKGLDEYKQGG